MLELLGKNEVMRSLPPAEIDALIPYLQEFETSEGSYLFKQGEAGDALYLITSGSLGVFVRKEGDAEGDGTRVDGITHGQVVGEMARWAGACGMRPFWRRVTCRRSRLTVKTSSIL